MWGEIRERIELYLNVRLGIPTTDISPLRKHYFEKYGTTLRGLQIHNQVDSEDFLSFVHDIPVKDYLQPVPDLRVILQSLPQKRWVFTNADAEHAKRVLAALGITDCFNGIVDIKALAYESKPNSNAYSKALRISGEPDPYQCVIFDDSPRNLKSAKQLGFFTVLVGRDEMTPEIDLHLNSFIDLPSELPGLWIQ